MCMSGILSFSRLGQRRTLFDGRSAQGPATVIGHGLPMAASRGRDEPSKLRLRRRYPGCALGSIGSECKTESTVLASLSQ